MALERMAFCLRKRAEREADIYFPSLSARTLVYKGMLTTAQLEPFFPDLSDRRLRHRAGPGALAVLHQHVPVLAAGPPLPADRAQRRDQHGQGQPQLDGGPGEPADQRRDPRRPVAAVADLHAGRERLGVLRRGARAAAPRRPVAAARGADDDPGGVGEPRRDGPGPPGLLRVPLGADGALGRPGLHHVHRRQPDRRGARPQRAAAQPLLGHRGRPGRARQRGRRARPRPGHRGPQGPAAAGPDVPRRHRPRPHRRRRRDQGRARRRGAVRRVAARRPDPPRRPARARARRAHPRQRHPAPADLRLHRGGAARPARRRWPGPAPSRSGRWAPTRRSPCSPTGRGCCSTTSASSSPRSPTRRWTRSARSSSPASAPRSARTRTCSTATPAHCRQVVLDFPVIDNDELAKILHINRDGDLPGFAAARIRGLYPVAGGGPALQPRLDDIFAEVSEAVAAGAAASSCCPTATPTPTGRRSRRCCSPAPCTTT